MNLTDSVTERCRLFYERRLQVAERFRVEEPCMPPDDAASPATGLNHAMRRLRNEIEILTCYKVLPKFIDQFQCHSIAWKRNMLCYVAGAAILKAQLMNQDNILFKQLLTLNDKIEDLKEQQENCEDDDDDEGGSRCGSLESLSDAEEGVTADQSASPTSTLSSSSSSTTHVYSRFLRPQQTPNIFRRTNITFQKEVSRPLKIVTKDASGRLLLVRTTKDSFLTTTMSSEMSAYDSGFHGSESDPENNEIFV